MPHHESPPVLEAENLTKRYGNRTALSECDLDIPQGRVIGLVGPNGAGKSTLLQLACGLIAPTSGTLAVLGARPAADAAHLAKVGFVAQDAPVYAGLTVADHLRLGAGLNPSWDPALAERRIAQVGLDPGQKAGRLSGGQRAQLALTVAAAKRPELLILDEPAAALDPLARHGFLDNLMEFVAELGASAVLSSHLLGDVERVCDYLVVLCDSRVQIAGDVGDLLAGHRRIIAPRGELDRLPTGIGTVWIEHTRQTSRAVVRTPGPLPDLPWTVEDVELEDLVLAYMNRAVGAPTGDVEAPAGEALR
jgi:ABC-2 type transport system ATP-binding protein